MKIQKFSLTNFRSHECTNVSFDRLNFIVGPNGAGKSSIAMALEFLLCGTCEVTDEGGKGAEDLIRKGEAESIVSAEIDTALPAPWNVKRTKRTSGQDLQLQGAGLLPLAEAQKKLSQRIGVPIEALRAILNSGRFVELDTAAQKKLLSQVLADQGIPVPADLQAEVGAPGPLTIVELDRAYKSAYERRTLLNRDAKLLSTLNVPEVLEAPKVGEIKAKLLNLSAERDTAIRTRHQLLSQSADSVKKRARIESDISALESLILPMQKERELNAIAEKAEGLRGADDVAAKLRVLISTKQDQIKAIVKLGLRAECPTCMRSLAKKDITDVGRALEDQIKELEMQLVKATDQFGAFKKALEAREQIRGSITAVGEREELQRELAEPPAPGQPIDMSALDQRVAEFDQRIAKGTDVLVKASALHQQIQAYNSDRARKASIDGDLAIVERIIAFAGPDGARKDAAGGKIAAFNSAMNAALEPFGFSAIVELEPFSVKVTCRGPLNSLLIHQLSESERFRFSIAFQIALAQITKVGLVVIDRADMLDKDLRRLLTSMLIQSGVQQAIVCSTSTDPLPAKTPAGVKFFQFSQENATTRLTAELPEVATAAA